MSVLSPFQPPEQSNISPFLIFFHLSNCLPFAHLSITNYFAILFFSQVLHLQQTPVVLHSISFSSLSVQHVMSFKFHLLLQRGACCYVSSISIPSRLIVSAAGSSSMFIMSYMNLQNRYPWRSLVRQLATIVPYKQCFISNFMEINLYFKSNTSL